MILIESRSEDETSSAGTALGRLLGRGDVLALAGELGAGKTCFVEGLARGLGIDSRVRSPSFALVQEHPAALPLYHVDLYRIADASEIEALGLEEVLEGEGVTAVEWFHRFPTWMPAERLDLRIEIVGPSARRIAVEPHGERYEALVDRWLSALAPK